MLIDCLSVHAGSTNPRGFNHPDVELARVRRYREPLALLPVDVDGLTGINDRHGHHAGDARFACHRVAVRTVRTGDVPSRMT